MKKVLSLAVVLLLLVCTGWGDEIGSLKAGANAKLLKSFGMPFPIDTGGWHVFENKSEKVLLRVWLTKKGSNVVISKVNLLYKGINPRESRLNEHLMLTGVSLKRLKTAKGISLGDSEAQVISRYGQPKGIKYVDMGKVLIYRGTIFFLKKGKVMSILVI